MSQRRSWLDGWLRSEQSALARGTGVSDTLTVEAVLSSAQRQILAAADTAARGANWRAACNYLSLAGRLAQWLTAGQRLEGSDRLAAAVLWTAAEDLERLTDTAQRLSSPELEDLTEAECALLDLALWSQRREERGL